MAAPQAQILLVRHGECVMNLTVDKLVGGRSNSSPLTPLGERQSAALGAHLARRLPGDAQLRCFSSTAVRARDTALHVMRHLSVPPDALEQSGELLELAQGEWEGRPRGDCYTPHVLRRIEADTWNFAPPGGESQRQVEERMLRFVLGSVLPAAAAGQTALVFSHGMAIKCLLRGLLNSDARMSRRITLHNTAVTELRHDAAGWHIARVNDTAHLLDLQ